MYRDEESSNLKTNSTINPMPKKCLVIYYRYTAWCSNCFPVPALDLRNLLFTLWLQHLTKPTVYQAR